MTSSDTATSEGATPSLDASWDDLATVLPRDGWWVVAVEHNSEDEVEPYRAVERSGTPHVFGPWADSPAAALRALTAALRESLR